MRIHSFAVFGRLSNTTTTEDKGHRVVNRTDLLFYSVIDISIVNYKQCQDGVKDLSKV